MRRGLILVMLIVSAALAHAGAGTPSKAPPLPEELKAKVLKLDKGTPLPDALAQIEKQAGIKVRDARGTKREAKLGQAFDQGAFWPTLDKIAGETGTAINHYAGDGILELVDRPNAQTPVSYHHAFRTTIKRISLTRDFDGGNRHCVIYLEAAWEPRLLPFLMDIASAAVTFAPDGNGKSLKTNQSGKGQIQIEGRPAQEFEVRVPAPERSSPMIQELAGSVVLTVPIKMLDLTLPNVAAGKSVSEDGVAVTLKKMVLQRDRWVLTMLVDNPPGTPKFESYQSWIIHNRIQLTNGKHQWRPRPADELVEKLTAQQAEVEYHFLLKDSPQPKSSPSDWTLHYRTPGRMVEVEVPYRFEKVPLP